MSIYTNIITEATACSLSDAEKVEEIMRDVVFHSTLDWQTPAELSWAAKLAYAVLKETELIERPRSAGSYV